MTAAKLVEDEHTFAAKLVVDEHTFAGYSYQQLRSLANKIGIGCYSAATETVLPALNVDILCTNSDRPTFGGDLLFNVRCSRKQKLGELQSRSNVSDEKAFVGLMMGREDTIVVYLNDGSSLMVH